MHRQAQSPLRSVAAGSASRHASVPPRESAAASSGFAMMSSSVAANANASLAGTTTALTSGSTKAAAALDSRTTTAQLCAMARMTPLAASAVAVAITHGLPAIGPAPRASVSGPTNVTAARSALLSRRSHDSQYDRPNGSDGVSSPATMNFAFGSFASTTCAASRKVSMPDPGVSSPRCQMVSTAPTSGMLTAGNRLRTRHERRDLHRCAGDRTASSEATSRGCVSVKSASACSRT